ncbi:MAG TPA: threonine/serine dehydratase [Ktedonobacteraceae bacterium]|nr:threonine/serine dehydratase [Ktedonobacteraceae bacterium]
MLSSADIEAAAQRISPYIRKTPVFQLNPGEWDNQAQLFLKLEQLQYTGSFKLRGAMNRMLSQPVPEAGVIAASGGNHGVAVAYAAQQLGYPSEIYVPEISSRAKIERLRNYGARVSIVGSSYAEALQASEFRAAETGALVIHAFDQSEVVAGQGTLARELEQQISDLDTVLVAVGGGGLIAGIASWFQGRVRVIGVQSEQTPAMSEALKAGTRVDVSVSGIAADSLGARRVGQLAFSMASRFVDRVLLVSDEAIRSAQRTLWQDLRLIVEPGGATALAGLLSGAYRPEPGERVAVILCGANTQLDTF